MTDRFRGMGVNARQYGIVGALIVIVLLFQILTDGRILMPDNVSSLLGQNAYVFILAIGMLMVIVAGHIDLSVGSVVATIGGVMGIAIADWELSWPIAILIGLVVGALIGAWQGFWVAYVGVPAFIVTLAGMLVFRGIALYLVAETRAGFPSGFNAISNRGTAGWLGYVANVDAVTLLIGGVLIAYFVISSVLNRRRRVRRELVVEPAGLFLGKLVVISLVASAFIWLLARSAKGFPFVLILVGVLVIIYTFVMGRTVFGRHIYAMGGNLAAARLSGVDTRKVNFFLFVNMGILAAVAATVVISRAGAVNAQAGQNYELDAIAACFIGGAAVTGGVGRVWGAMVGALVMGVLNMGLSIMGVDPSWQQIIKGLVLLLAVAFDLVNKRRTGRLA